MLFSDTHCHLNFKELGPYLDGVLSSSAAKGVHRFIIPGTCSRSWREILDLSLNFPSVFPALGLHPAFEHASYSDDLECLERQFSDNDGGIIAVGEAGLDRRCAGFQQQIEIFEAQAYIAKKFQKPLIVHSVKAHADVCAVIKSTGVCSGVVHAFSGSYEEAMNFIGLGFKLGVGSVIMRTKGKTAKALAKVPLESLVLETDSPDMYLPSSYSRIGTPIDVVAIAQKVAELRGVSLEEVAEVLETNVNRLFPSLDNCCV